MPRSFRGAKIDANQTEIVRFLRAHGYSVQSIAAVGSGCPDLLVGKNGVNVLLEVKMGTGKMRPMEVSFAVCWRGQVATVRSAEEALAICKKLTSPQ